MTQSCPTLCDPMTAAHQASLSFTISQSLLKLMSIESMMPSNRLILCRPLLLLPSLFPYTTLFRSITNSHSLYKLMSIESVMPTNRLILCRPLLLLPSIFPRIRVFSKSQLFALRWPKYWSFSFSISPSNEYSGLIPFRIDWLDLIAVQGTLKSLL